MMTIKDLKNILIHFEDDCYDDYEVILWDYNHQRKLDWGGCRSFNKLDKTYTFSIKVPTEDGINIFERLKMFCKNQQENGICKKNKY